MRSFTASDKLTAIERELGYRRRVFARRVEERRMKQSQADHEIAVFEAIADDYREQAEIERAAADLFLGRAE